MREREIKTRSWRHALAMALGLAYACGAVAQGAPAKHVFLVVIDTLRADHLTPYGYSRNTTPFLDEIAQQGILFENAYSASSFTRESVSAMFTGRFPSSGGAGAGWLARPAEGRITLAEHFQRAGYATALYADTPMLEDPMFARGFDEAKCLPEYNRSLLGGKVLERAQQFIERNAGRNTFIYLHLMDPHSPYEPPKEFYERFGPPAPAGMPNLGDLRSYVPELLREGFGPGEARFEHLVRAYDGEIAYQDELLRGFVDWLQQRGMWDESFFLLTADHGEEFLEHGFVEHAWGLYAEVLRVPLILWSGARITPGREAARVSNVGIFETLLDVAEIPRNDVADYGGLLAPVDGRWAAQSPGQPIISELRLAERSMLRSVIVEDYHYLAGQQWLDAEQCAAASFYMVQRRLRREFEAGVRQRPDPWGPVTREALFNLAMDPLEQKDLTPQGGVALERCRAVLADYVARCRARGGDAR